MITLRKKEIFRYLGYQKTVPSTPVQERIEACTARLMEAAQPAFVCRRLPILRPADSDGVLQIGTLSIQSRDLSRNLKGCEEVFLFGATLGIGPDRLIRRAEVSAIADAAIYQAAAAEMIEAYLNLKMEDLRQSVRKEGYTLCPRFSPGYGDCPLEIQREISVILNMPKEIGVCLSDSLLMIPSKSVTAFSGLLPGTVSPFERETEGCLSCGKTDCLYRKRTDSIFSSAAAETYYTRERN